MGKEFKKFNSEYDEDGGEEKKKKKGKTRKQSREEQKKSDAFSLSDSSDLTLDDLDLSGVEDRKSKEEATQEVEKYKTVDATGEEREFKVGQVIWKITGDGEIYEIKIGEIDKDGTFKKEDNDFDVDFSFNEVYADKEDVDKKRKEIEERFVDEFESEYQGSDGKHLFKVGDKVYFVKSANSILKDSVGEIYEKTITKINPVNGTFKSDDDDFFWMSFSMCYASKEEAEKASEDIKNSLNKDELPKEEDNNNDEPKKGLAESVMNYGDNDLKEEKEGSENLSPNELSAALATHLNKEFPAEESKEGKKELTPDKLGRDIFEKTNHKEGITLELFSVLFNRSKPKGKNSNDWEVKKVFDFLKEEGFIMDTGKLDENKKNIFIAKSRVKEKSEGENALDGEALTDDEIKKLLKNVKIKKEKISSDGFKLNQIVIGKNEQGEIEDGWKVVGWNNNKDDEVLFYNLKKGNKRAQINPDELLELQKQEVKEDLGFVGESIENLSEEDVDKKPFKQRGSRSGGMVETENVPAVEEGQEQPNEGLKLDYAEKYNTSAKKMQELSEKYPPKELLEKTSLECSPQYLLNRSALEVFNDSLYNEEKIDSNKLDNIASWAEQEGIRDKENGLMKEVNDLIDVLAEQSAGNIAFGEESGKKKRVIKEISEKTFLSKEEVEEIIEHQEMFMRARAEKIVRGRKTLKQGIAGAGSRLVAYSAIGLATGGVGVIAGRIYDVIRTSGKFDKEVDKKIEEYKRQINPSLNINVSASNIGRKGEDPIERDVISNNVIADLALHIQKGINEKQEEKISEDVRLESLTSEDSDSKNLSLDDLDSENSTKYLNERKIKLQHHLQDVNYYLNNNDNINLTPKEKKELLQNVYLFEQITKNVNDDMEERLAEEKSPLNKIIEKTSDKIGRLKKHTWFNKFFDETKYKNLSSSVFYIALGSATATGRGLIDSMVGLRIGKALSNWAGVGGKEQEIIARLDSDNLENANEQELRGLLSRQEKLKETNPALLQKINGYFANKEQKIIAGIEDKANKIRNIAKSRNDHLEDFYADVKGYRSQVNREKFKQYAIQAATATLSFYTMPEIRELVSASFHGANDWLGNPLAKAKGFVGTSVKNAGDWARKNLLESGGLNAGIDNKPSSPVIQGASPSVEKPISDIKTSPTKASTESTEISTPTTSIPPVETATPEITPTPTKTVSHTDTPTPEITPTLTRPNDDELLKSIEKDRAKMEELTGKRGAEDFDIKNKTDEELQQEFLKSWQEDYRKIEELIKQGEYKEAEEVLDASKENVDKISNNTLGKISFQKLSNLLGARLSLEKVDGLLSREEFDINEAQDIINKTKVNANGAPVADRRELLAELNIKQQELDGIKNNQSANSSEAVGRGINIDDRETKEFDFTNIKGSHGLFGAAEQVAKIINAEELNKFNINSDEYKAALIHKADRIKDLLVEDIKAGGSKFNLTGITDPDKISQEQFDKINWDKVAEEMAEDKVFHKELSDSEVENIIKKPASIKATEEVAPVVEDAKQTEIQSFEQTTVNGEPIKTEQDLSKFLNNNEQVVKIADQDSYSLVKMEDGKQILIDDNFVPKEMIQGDNELTSRAHTYNTEIKQMEAYLRDSNVKNPFEYMKQAGMSDYTALSNGQLESLLKNDLTPEQAKTALNIASSNNIDISKVANHFQFAKSLNNITELKNKDITSNLINLLDMRQPSAERASLVNSLVGNGSNNYAVRANPIGRSATESINFEYKDKKVNNGPLFNINISQDRVLIYDFDKSGSTTESLKNLDKILEDPSKYIK